MNLSICTQVKYNRRDKYERIRRELLWNGYSTRQDSGKPPAVYGVRLSRGKASDPRGGPA